MNQFLSVESSTDSINEEDLKIERYKYDLTNLKKKFELI